IDVVGARHLVHAHAELEVREVDDVALLELRVRDEPPVHEGAVRAAEVADAEGVDVQGDLGVLLGNGVRGKGQGRPRAPGDPDGQGTNQDAPAVAPFGPALQEPPLRRLAANRRARVAHSVVGRTRPHRAGSSHKTPNLRAWVSRRRLTADFAAASGVVSGITKRLRPLPIGRSGHTLEAAVPRRDPLAGGSRMWSFAAVLVFAAATAG